MPLPRLLGIACAGAAASLAFACGLELTGSKVVADPPVEASIDVAPNLPPAGDAGADDADAGKGARDADCPKDRGGSALVRMPDAAFCLEATEVSNAQYDAFLAATDGGRLDVGVPEGGLPPACGALTSFARVGVIFAPPAQTPVTRIPWCAAYAYCAWLGKRLCLGSTAPDRDAAAGEWYSACSAAGTRELPYGDAATYGVCNTDDLSASAVGSYPGCEGGVPGLFDMVGNVEEWVDACNDAGTCPVVGGYHSTGVDYATCRTSSDISRASASSAVGFRCCADVE